MNSAVYHRIFRWQYTPLLLILIVAVLVWPASLAGPFQFDDWNVIVEQPRVHGLSEWWASMPGIRALLKLSYALNWVADPTAFSFHLVNLLIHGINIVLVWYLLRAWPQLDRIAVVCVTLVFALHPVQTEAVTYISGRSVSLMSLLLLLSILCWLRGRGLWRLVAITCFLLAVAVRETALILPLVLFVWQCLAGMRWRQALRELAPMGWLLLALALLGAPMYGALMEASLATRGPLENLALQMDALRYLLLEPLLLLRNNIDPDLSQRPGFDVAWWISFLFLIAAVSFAWRQRNRQPGIALAIAWFLLCMFPTNGPLARFDVVAERHLYLALIGPAVILVTVLRSIIPQRLVILPLAALGFILTLATVARITDYRSESALWEATARASPNKARVWNNLGHAYLVEKKPDRAIPALHRALELDPDFMRAEINLERAVEAVSKAGKSPTGYR